MANRYDVQGEAEVSAAIVEQINACPFLDGETVVFASLDDTGLAVYPNAAGVIQRERHDITDHVTQDCAYTFAVVSKGYGQTETRKINDKALLDALGRWLEREPVDVNGTIYLLDEYEALPNGRKFLAIERISSATLDAIGEDQSELWVIQMRAIYRNEYNKTPII